MKREVQVIELVLNSRCNLKRVREVKVCRTNQKLKMIIKSQQDTLVGHRIDITTNSAGVFIKNHSAVVDESGICYFSDLRFIGKSGRGIAIDLFFKVNGELIAEYPKAIKGDRISLKIQ